MLITIEKYDIVKGITYKRQFNLDTNCIALYNDGLTTAVIHGDFKDMAILCRDSEKVNFISLRISDNYYKDFTCYLFDTIYYFDNNDEMKVLISTNDLL